MATKRTEQILAANQTDILGYPRYPFGMSGDALRAAGFGLLSVPPDQKPDPHWKGYSHWTKLDLGDIVIRCESRVSTYTDNNGRETLESFLLIGRREVLFDESGGSASVPDALEATKQWLGSQYSSSLMIPSASYATVYQDANGDLAWVEQLTSNVLLQYQTRRCREKIGEPVCLQTFP
jgi:hypothetical protein